MPYADYTYNFASNLKAPPFSFGRVAFDDTTTDKKIATVDNSGNHVLMDQVMRCSFSSPYFWRCFCA